MKFTCLVKRWGRNSRVISCSIRNIWTVGKFIVLPQLQIGQHLLKLKMIEEKSFYQMKTLKLDCLLLRNSVLSADGYFLKVRNSLKKHTPGKGKGSKTVFSCDSVRCIPCIYPPLTGCVRDLCPRFWKAQLILTAHCTKLARGVSGNKKSQNTTEGRRGTRPLRDFGPSRDVPSAGAPWPWLSFQSETVGFTPSVWRPCHTVLALQGRDSYIKGWTVVYLTSKSLLLCTRGAPKSTGGKGPAESL